MEQALFKTGDCTSERLLPAGSLPSWKKKEPVFLNPCLAWLFSTHLPRVQNIWDINILP
jgi:hypothetical protein